MIYWSQAGSLLDNPVGSVSGWLSGAEKWPVKILLYSCGAGGRGGGLKAHPVYFVLVVRTVLGPHAGRQCGVFRL